MASRPTESRPTTSPPLAPLILAALLLVLHPSVARSQGNDEGPAVTAEELPDPDLAGLDQAVAEQLREMRRFVARQITETEASPAQLAEPIGELGRLYLTYQLAEAAERSLRLADRLAPRDFRWPYHLGYLHQGDGRLDAAARYYERALAVHPGVPPAMIRLARVYAALDHPERAEWVLREVLARDPSSAAAQAALGELLVARKLYREGEELLRSALEQEPGADRLYHPLAAALSARGEGEAAAAALEQAGTAGLEPADPLIDGLAELAIGERMHLLRGRTAYQAGEFEAAAEEFRRAAEVNPESVPARVNLGSALGRLGDVEGAMTEYRRAIEIAPANVTALHNLGALHLQRGELPEALERLTSAALYAPDDGRIRHELADALRLNGRADDALLHYRKAAELAPPGEMARFREAQILSDTGLHGLAVERLEEGYEIAPTSSLLALTLARLLASAPDLSVRDGERALEILSSAPIRRSLRSLETLAMAHAEAGDCDAALEWQSQAWEAALDADDASLAEELGRMATYYQESRPCRYPVESAAAGEGG